MTSENAGAEGTQDTQSTQDLAGKGAIVVAATGNQGCACVLYPAAYSSALAVGAVDTHDVLRSYSNTGPEVDVVAPGTNWTTSVTVSGGYAAFSGTGDSWRLAKWGGPPYRNGHQPEGHPT